MARPSRIRYLGAVYHVMARGSRGQAIFADDKDRQRFLETLAEGCQKNRLRRLRAETTMILDWIAGELNMGGAGSLANLLRKTK